MPADLQWLLNERAAVAGELDRLTTRLKVRESELRRAGAIAQNLRVKVSEIEALRAPVVAKLDALHRTRGIDSSDVDPTSGGVVHARAERWGRRGALAEVIAQTLRETSPQALPISAILARVQPHFGIKILEPSDRDMYMDAVRHARYPLCDQHGHGVESFWAGATVATTVSRWKQGQTLADLRKQAP